MQPTLRAIIAAPLLLFLPAACTREPRVILEPKAGQPVEVFVEVADTPEKRALGLMYRTDLGPDQGMIFFFERDAEHGFWMKNTPLSLDMIFISSEGTIVGIAADTEPFSLKQVRAGAPSRAVLEVRAGFAERHGIAVGDHVRYGGISSSLAP